MATWAACCVSVSFGGVLSFGGIECSWLAGHPLVGAEPPLAAAAVGEGDVISSQQD